MYGIYVMPCVPNCVDGNNNKHCLIYNMKLKYNISNNYMKNNYFILVCLNL
jgi:hypothetical protein